MTLPSKILEEAVEQLASLPGVGKRSALRYALFLMNEDESKVRDLSEALMHLKTHLHHCRHCHNVSDTEVCPICSSEKRQRGIICVVENVQDVMSIEQTQMYRGLYHVLGGVISPMDGVGPGQLEIESLIERVSHGGVEEVIFALSSTMEGDATNFYISRKLQRWPEVKLTMLARGMSINDELQYTDEVTLGRSLVNRVPVKDR